MQSSLKSTSLNSVRAFEAAARLRSLKAAGAELGVTASAVGHQVRQLEAATCNKLFARRHNAIELTAEGARLFADVSPAIQIIVRASQALQRDASTITVKASHSLAVRWLVPRLRTFAQWRPSIQVNIETASPPISLGPGIDIAIPYRRARHGTLDGFHLMADWGLPVRSPSLSAMRSSAPQSIPYPLIGAATDDWDWKQYAEETGLDMSAMQITSRFDTDQAALEACLCGLGVSLLTREFIKDELADGRLVPIESLPSIRLGGYWIVASNPRSRAADTFISWLKRQVASVGPSTLEGTE